MISSNAGWAFIVDQHLSGLSVVGEPSCDLYSITADGDNLPIAQEVKAGFWTEDEVGYGSANTVVSGEYAYLYGTTSTGLALARVKTDADFTDRSSYEFYVNGAWTSTTPTKDDSTITLAQTSTAQGTIYYSDRWSSFVWLGGSIFPGATAYLATAPAPEGPWTTTSTVFEGEGGTNADIPAYSVVAHPALTGGTGDYIFIVRRAGVVL